MTPHTNFISLRSGSDSTNSQFGVGLLQTGVSCDTENSDYNMDSSLSLHHHLSSQYLQPPMSSSGGGAATSVSNSNANSTTTTGQINIYQTVNSRSTTPVDNETVLTTSQRPINPISSLRRHMFVNSRRNAHTTVDHTANPVLNFTQDSICDEYQIYGNYTSEGMERYDLGSMSMSMQIPILMDPVGQNSMDQGGGQIMTSFIETIDECHPDEDYAKSSMKFINTRGKKLKSNIFQSHVLIFSNYLADNVNGEIDLASELSNNAMSTSANNNNNKYNNSNNNNKKNNYENDPHLLDPTWIPLIVRRTLLDMHKSVLLSKSESNIKYRSTNHLLHSPTTHSNPSKTMSAVNSRILNKKEKLANKKKPLSLQNSEDKSVFNCLTPQNARSQQQSGNLLNIVYDELRSKFLRNNSVDKSASTAKPERQIQHSLQQSSFTNISTAATKQGVIDGGVGDSGSGKGGSVNLASSFNLNSKSNSTVMCIYQPVLVIEHNKDEPDNILLERLVNPPPRKQSSACGGFNKVDTSMSLESDCTVILNVKAMERHADVSEEENSKEESINKNMAKEKNYNNEQLIEMLVLAPNVSSDSLGSQV